jgi:hypothetical protein
MLAHFASNKITRELQFAIPKKLPPEDAPRSKG